MTEAEWLGATDPPPLLSFLQDRGSCRRHRLLGCALCRRIWSWLSDARSRSAVETAERYADGEVAQQVLSAAHVGADRALEPWGRRNFVEMRAGERASATRARAAALAAKSAARPTNYPNKLARSVREAHHCAALAEFGYRLAPPDQTAVCDLIRDIFGNPFRPVAFAPEWRTGTAVAIAAGMYESRDFGAMPILADALQDAGCDSDDLLDHCRDPHATHVRGCWVVDLVLGKE